MKNNKRTGTMTTVSDTFLHSQLRKQIYENPSFHFRLFQEKWKDFAGDIMAKESYIGYEKEGILYIYVTNSVWLQQLFMNKRAILQKIKQDDYGKQIKDLRFIQTIPKIKKTGDTSLSQINAHFQKEHDRYDTDLTKEEEMNIQDWISTHVASNKVRDILSPYMKASFSRKKGEIKAGFHPCPICRNYISEKETLCITCTTRLEQSKIGKIILILKENPHYTYRDVKNLFPCDYSTYASAKEQLIQRIRQQIYLQIEAPYHKRFLLSLLLHKPLKDISLREAEKKLKDLPQTKNDVINQK